jgi:hypothetical protein
MSCQKTTRGRKSVVTLPNTEQKVILKQHHFDYSADFANKLYAFAKSNLECTSKEYKHAWTLWVELNSDQIQKEITRIKNAGYEGDVNDKMYFSARYYYRKKAIRNKDTAETTEPTEQPEKEQDRKKYATTEKMVLKQINDHISSQIYCNDNQSDASNHTIVRNIMPSTSFADYCLKYGISTEDAQIKKTYKNMYWRISKKLATISSDHNHNHREEQVM